MSQNQYLGKARSPSCRVNTFQVKIEKLEGGGVGLKKPGIQGGGGSPSRFWVQLIPKKACGCKKIWKKKKKKKQKKNLYAIVRGRFGPKIDEKKASAKLFTNTHLVARKHTNEGETGLVSRVCVKKCKKSPPWITTTQQGVFHRKREREVFVLAL